jgi:hypothetical protein
MKENYLTSVYQLFQYYKKLGEDTFVQVNESQHNWQFNEMSNSIATIVKHLSGNMLSRWTDFLKTDGEKENRNRDAEFESENLTIEQMLFIWQKGWDCLFETLKSLTDEDLQKEIYIRNQGHTVIEAINRQLAHYSYHIGQIVFIGKIVVGNNWNSLSIPKGTSQKYNAEKLSKSKHSEHFTKEYLNKTKNE